MLQVVLTECITASSKEITDEVLGKIGSILRDLIAIGVVIRRSGRKFRLQKADASFDQNRDKYRDLQAHLAILVMSSPSEGPRTLIYQDKIDPSQLSPIQHRLVEANLRRRHRFMEMQRHSHLLKDPIESPVWNKIGHILANMGPSSAQKVSDKSSVKPEHTKSTTTSIAQSNNMTVVETIASIPETGFRGLQRGGRIGSTVTRITAITAAARYPRAKLSSPEHLSFKCPCCCHAIPIQEAEDNRYKTHLANDICPYTCILEHCPTPHKLFVTEKEWKEHFLNDHPPGFQCSYCDSAPFSSLVEIMGHLQLEHPDISNDELADALAESPVHIMGISNCPLCDSEDSPDSPELIEHILQHIHDFSLRSLPWPQDRIPHLSKAVGNFNPAIDDADHIIKWVLKTSPDSKCELQLCELDKNPPMEAETASDSFKDDYFSQNDYFVDDSSDGNLHSQRTQNASQMTRTMETSELGDEDSLISTDNGDRIVTVEEMSNAMSDNGDDSNDKAHQLGEEVGNVDTRSFREDSSQLNEDDSSDDEGRPFSKEYLEERKQVFERDMQFLRKQIPPPPLEDSHIVSLLMRIQLLGKIAQEQTIGSLPDAIGIIPEDHPNVPSDLNSLSNTSDFSHLQCLDVPLRVDRMRSSSKLNRGRDAHRYFKSPEPYGSFEDRDRAESKLTSQQHDETPFPRKGKTVIRRKLVHIRAILDLGYPFKEEEDQFLILKALSKEQIEEVIDLSRKFQKPMDMRTGRDHDGNPVDQNFARKRTRSSDNHRYRMDSPHGAMDPSHETSIMPPSRLPLPSGYRDDKYREEIEQIGRPNTKTTSRPRSASLDTHDRSSSPIRYIQPQGTPLEEAHNSESRVVVRSRDSDQDMSDYIRELEEERILLGKTEEEEEETILFMKKRVEEAEDRILLIKKKIEEEEEEDRILSMKNYIVEEEKWILVMKKKIEEEDERILNLKKKEKDKRKGEYSSTFSISHSDQLCTIILTMLEPSSRVMRAMMATLT
ncbi:uncharacterized protein N7503_002034 [Penicillium pulvis]|uniref:uncharacterized protein n=1 Tax=Penicillium pulvis TaxID=1562058 RepID=UPI002548062F|nr:uncharacterized protein N7503_002034 [Penicillium pulvis]KAJ5809816.1 hypothetical protein N7503_002034 [Penicillium pulvis]